MKIKKILFLTMVIFVAFGTYYYVLFYNFKFVFPFNCGSKNFKFYYQNKLQNRCFINSEVELKTLCDDINSRLATSEFYDSTSFKANIFLTDNPFTHYSFSFFTSSSHAFCLWKLNGQVVVIQDFVCDRAGNYTPKLLAHELTHKVLVEKFGKQEYKKIPTWLLEGYCEYISNASNPTFINTEGTFMPKSAYDDYHLAVIYLLNQQKNSVEQLFESTPVYSSIIEDAKKWNLTKNKLASKYQHL